MSASLHELVEDVVARMVTDVPSEALRSRVLDPAAAVVDGAGRVVHCSSLRHLPTLGEAARRIRSHRRLRAGPGDIVILNDPFSGGTRVQDVYAVRFAHVADCQHWLLVARMTVIDLGGDLFGGYNPRATEIWAQGARFTPVVIYSGGRWVRDTMTCLILNSRTPRLLEAQIQALAAGLETAAPLLRNIIRSGELDALTNASAPEESLNVTDLTHACGDAPLPADGQLSVRVELRPTTSGIAVDFRKSDTQSANYYNASRSTTTSVVLETLITSVAPGMLINDRLLASFEISTTPGTVVDAAYPAPTGCGPIVGAHAIREALSSALKREPPRALTNSLLSPEGQLEERLGAELIEDEARCARAYSPRS